MRVVVLHGVGVQTDEAHVGGRECEVGRSENLLEHRFARTLAVVIAQQADVRYAQAVEDVALPHELFFQPEIREVAAVEHEVDVVAGVERFDGFSVSSYQRCVSLIMAKRTVCLRAGRLRCGRCSWR